MGVPPKSSILDWDFPLETIYFLEYSHDYGNPHVQQVHFGTDPWVNALQALDSDDTKAMQVRRPAAVTDRWMHIEVPYDCSKNLKVPTTKVRESTPTAG